MPSYSTDCSFINYPTAATAAAISSSYFVPAILDLLFRSTITEYSATEDFSTKCFTTSSAIKSSTFIRYLLRGEVSSTYENR